MDGASVILLRQCPGFGFSTVKYLQTVDCMWNHPLLVHFWYIIRNCCSLRRCFQSASRFLYRDANCCSHFNDSDLQASYIIHGPRSSSYLTRISSDSSFFFFNFFFGFHVFLVKYFFFVSSVPKFKYTTDLYTDFQT